jgi:spore germination cell wall hydrolase CwlJ-like protein
MFIRGECYMNFIKAAILSATLIIPYFIVEKVYEFRVNRLADYDQRTTKTFSSISEMERELRCMTRNVYYEAGGEPVEGKIAVAQVTLNRAKDGRFGAGICGVVNEKSVVFNKVLCQFSWLCDGSESRRQVNKAIWQESEVAAKKVLLENFTLPSLESALYFHADYVNPQWKGMEKVAKIGHHIFYKPKTESNK